MVCGTTKSLDFDHVDPMLKIKEVTTLLSTASLAMFWQEVAKCQLLCKEHHKIKTRLDRAPAHGSDRRYRSPWRCRCEVCVAGSKERNRRTVERRQQRGKVSS